MSRVSFFEEDEFGHLKEEKEVRNIYFTYSPLLFTYAEQNVDIV
jgi:hypothetical protein